MSDPTDRIVRVLRTTEACDWCQKTVRYDMALFGVSMVDPLHQKCTCARKLAEAVMRECGEIAASRCGCPEQYKGRFCPACGGTGWIIQHRVWQDVVEKIRALGGGGEG